MNVQVGCPNRDCDQTLSLSPEMAGKKGKCPKCGKSFQIPKNLGQSQAGSTAQHPAQSKPAGKKQPAPGKSTEPKTQPAKTSVAKPTSPKPTSLKPAARETAARQKTSTPKKPVPEKRSGPEKIDEAEFADMLVDDDSEAVFADDMVIDEFEPEPAPRRRSSPSRYSEDVVEDYEENDDDYSRPSNRSKGGLSIRKRRKLTGIGFWILSIATCVFAGTFALTLLSELLSQIGIAATKRGLFDAGLNIYKVAQGFAIAALAGLMVGGVFLLFEPNRYFSLAYAIGALVMAITNFVLQMIFVQISAFQENLGEVYSRSIHAGLGGGRAPGGDEVLSMFFEFFIVAGLVMTAFFMWAVARAQKQRQQRDDCMKVIFTLAGFAGGILMMYIFMFIGDVGTGKWLVYIVRILNWGANATLAAALVFHIQNLFYAAKTST
ncbi:MAG: hypothetical protein Tsb009_12640 [Planctomycetaceae bacterium]